MMGDRAHDSAQEPLRSRSRSNSRSNSRSHTTRNSSYNSSHNNNRSRESHQEEERSLEERTLFVLSQDEDQHLLTVEGEGVVNIVEHRAEVLRRLLGGCLGWLFAGLPCFMLGYPCRRPIRDGDGDGDGDTDGGASRAPRQPVWPRGFGPGWAIRTFCPLILLGWVLVLHNGATYGLDLFHSLNAGIRAPAGSRCDQAETQYLNGFKHAAHEDFPANTVLLIERRDGGSALTPEVRQFCRTLQAALHCPRPAATCTNDVAELATVWQYEGFFVMPSAAAGRAAAALFVNADESATMVHVKHDLQHGLHRAFFDYLSAFIASNGPNAALYRVSFTNEQKMLNIAQDEVIFDFEHADLIGIPFAWVILLWYCGHPAFLVCVSLPVCILASFAISVQWMPADISLPTFAPSMIVSMAVALNVDYALFMLVRYSEELTRGAARNFALDKAMSTAGKTIAVSGSIMLVSNGCLYFVKAETVASLGVALALTNLVTIGTNVTLLPALLHCFGSSFDWVRRKREGFPTMSGGLRAALLLLAFPLRWGFDQVFGSGRKRKRVVVLRQANSQDDADGLLLDDDQDSVATPLALQLQLQLDLDLEQEGEFVGSSQSLATAPLPVLAPTAGTVGTVGTVGAVGTGEVAVGVGMGAGTGVGGEGEGEGGEEGGLEATVTSTTSTGTEAVEAARRRAESSRILSAQSRVWAAIAKLCLSYPRGVILTVAVACAPVCWQVGRFQWTDGQANLVPAHNQFVQEVARLGEAGFVPGFLSDYKAIVASPLSSTSRLPLVREACFDDDAGLQLLLAAARSLRPGLPGPPENAVTCERVAAALPGCAVPDSVARRVPMLRGLVRNLCPYACNSCRVELLGSQEFWRHLEQATAVLARVSRGYMTVSRNASGGGERAAAAMLESPALFLGRRYAWADARRVLSADFRTAAEDEVDVLYRERFHNMTAFNGSLTATQALVRLRPPFQPFDHTAHPWVNALHAAMGPGAGGAGFNDPQDPSSFRFFLGGSVVRLFDQVDQVFHDTPPVMLTAVVLTVLGTSVVVFQSVLLGPRLLVTIALTLGLVFGCMVLIFQDLGASPESAGLYWIVPILGVPIMVGCTLDYDSFVVARIFEMRLAALSTEAAVFAGLQETGHVITIAGLIMTVAFGSMCLSAIPVVQQIGGLLVTCCLLDTFIVRSLLVPSLMLVAVDLNWFPKKMPPVRITMDMLRAAAAKSKRDKRENSEAAQARRRATDADELDDGAADGASANGRGLSS